MVYLPINVFNTPSSAFFYATPTEFSDKKNEQHSSILSRSRARFSKSLNFS